NWENGPNRDGFKGYLTNPAPAACEVYEQYSGLWVIERAYRVIKGTLEMRPMFHFTPKRMEAHVCICFVVYKVCKEPERILKANDILGCRIVEVRKRMMNKLE
ncbi:MAG: hypothetical protein LBU37_13345, partial [Tannerellaceae bacterium]|nr:hypothetical protein [Tannerellaceae bacterium]